MTTILSIQSFKAEIERIENETYKSRMTNVQQIGKNIELQVFMLSRLTFSMVSNKAIFQPLTSLQEVSSLGESDGEYLLKYARCSASLSPVMTSYLAAWDKFTEISVFTLDGNMYSYNNSKSERFEREEHSYINEEWFKQMDQEGSSWIAYIYRRPDHVVGNSITVLSYIRKLVNIDTGKKLG